MKRYFVLCCVSLLLLTVLSGCMSGGKTMAARGVFALPEDTASTAQKEALGISRQQAAEIALNHVGLTMDQVTGLQVDFSVDHGAPEYDVEFIHQSYAYEFEIHGQTGKILSFDKEYVQNES